jgi:hypothetical protein
MRERKKFPLWGAIALPAGLLWGPLVGGGIGYAFGDFAIGAAIGAAIGVGVGLSLLAAAIVVVSADL